MVLRIRNVPLQGFWIRRNNARSYNGEPEKDITELSFKWISLHEDRPCSSIYPVKNYLIKMENLEAIWRMG
jgi:hypothetical protein